MKNFKINITILCSLLFLLVIPKQVFAVPVVSITSPASLEQLSSGGTVNVVGTATANTSVNLLLDGNSVGTTSVDGSGNWSLTLSNVSTGSHSLEAIVTKEGKTLFAAAGSPGSVNSIEPNTGILNTLANMPISITQPAPALAVSPDGDIAYASGYTSTSQYLVKVDLLTGATSQVAGLPINSKITNGVFSADGTKYYAPDSTSGAAQVFVIDVASNTLSSTINIGSGLINVAAFINGEIYLNDFGTAEIHVINPNDDTFTTFSPSCATTDITAEPENSSSYWVGCTNGNILQLAVSDNGTLTTIDSGYGSSVLGITRLLGSTKIFVTNVFSGNDLKVFDTQTQGLLGTVSLGGQPWYLLPSYDNTKIIATLPGVGLSGTNVAVVDVNSYNVQIVDGTGSSLKASNAYTQTASTTTNFSIASLVDSSSENNNTLAETGDDLIILKITSLITTGLSLLLILFKYVKLSSLFN